MKSFVVLAALIAAISAIPTPHHHPGHHGNPGNQGTSATAQAPPPAAATNTASSGGATNSGQSTTSGSIDPNLVPDFGLQAGLDPDGTGNCKAANGKDIPCSCPPDRNAFIQKLGQFVSAGSFFGTLPAPFPTGNTNQDALTRIDTIISTLQNFDGKPGVGCPAISAPNFSVVQQQLLSSGA